MLAIMMVALLQPPPVAVVITDPTQTVVKTQTWTFKPNGDNWADIKAIIDYCEATPGRELVLFPAGTWKVSKSVEFVGNVDYRGAGMDKTIFIPFDGKFAHPMFHAGCAWRGFGGTRAEAHNFSMTDLTINQTVCTSFGSHCAFFETCDDVRIERCQFLNAKHEGLVSGGWNRRWYVADCIAKDIGAGSQYRRLSGAAFNINGIDCVVIRCKAYRCGQGYEHGGIRGTFINCESHGRPTDPDFIGPWIGFNMGNAVIGLHYTRIIGGAVTNDYWQNVSAVGFGNVIGRCSGVLVDGLYVKNGNVGFMGGKTTNHVPSAEQGPDLVGSHFRNIKFDFDQWQNYSAIGYSSGIGAEDGKIFGRESLTVENCEANYINVPVTQQNTPIFAVGGLITGKVLFKGCVVRGLDGAPGRGDFAVFSVIDNATADRSPNIRYEDCRAYRSDGKERWFTPKRERGE
jgi:hypothetical protein